MQKRFSRDHWCRGRSKPGCRIVGSHTRWELTTWADFQLCLHQLLMSTGCKSSHSGFLDVSCSNGGLRISGWIGQLSCLTIFLQLVSGSLQLNHASDSMFVRITNCFYDYDYDWRFNVREHWKPWERCRTEGARDEAHGRVQLHIAVTCVSWAWPDWGAILCCWIAMRQSR